MSNNYHFPMKNAYYQHKQVVFNRIMTYCLPGHLSNVIIDSIYAKSSTMRLESDVKALSDIEYAATSKLSGYRSLFAALKKLGFICKIETEYWHYNKLKTTKTYVVNPLISYTAKIPFTQAVIQFYTQWLKDSSLGNIVDLEELKIDAIREDLIAKLKRQSDLGREDATELMKAYLPSLGCSFEEECERIYSFTFGACSPNTQQERQQAKSIKRTLNHSLHKYVNEFIDTHIKMLEQQGVMIHDGESGHYYQTFTYKNLPSIPSFKDTELYKEPSDEEKAQELFEERQAQIEAQIQTQVELQEEKEETWLDIAQEYTEKQTRQKEEVQKRLKSPNTKYHFEVSIGTPDDACYDDPSFDDPYLYDDEPLDKEVAYSR